MKKPLEQAVKEIISQYDRIGEEYYCRRLQYGKSRTNKTTSIKVTSKNDDYRGRQQKIHRH